MDAGVTIWTGSKRGGYSLELDLAPIMSGKVELPNFEEIDLEQGIAAIACGFGLQTVDGVKNAKVPGSDSTWGHWARYFLETGQGGQLYGSGYVIWYQPVRWDPDRKPKPLHAVGKVGRFAICKHEKVDDPSANHMRGWHPGHCSKCGLDMTVDSGD